MNFKLMFISGCILFSVLILTWGCGNQQEIHVWEMVEITLEAEDLYENPYTDVDVWVQLKGPDFDKKVWGFWDGDNVYKVRVVAKTAGEWTWKSGSNVDDSGLINKSGKFKAISWTKDEIKENLNRRGFIRTNPDAPHGYIYADGTPFFLLADTWWAAFTWRYPLEGKLIPEDYIPDATSWCFEGGIQWLKKLGFNSIAVIASFPNWKKDELERTIQDNSGVPIRSGWPKAPDGKHIKDMHDEAGNMPFAFPGKSDGKNDLCANYDLINPAYWQNMDKKMDYLYEQGFIPYIETVRRSHFISWKTYHDFDKSYSRYLNYIKARYGAYNFIYSLTHNDGVPEGEGKHGFIHQAIKYYHNKYGGMPFGQPVTAMMARSSMEYLGHVDESPFLTCHSFGNWNRDHRILKYVEEVFNTKPEVPGFSNEPYYSWHDVSFGRPDGERVIPNSDRDNYFARAHAYDHFFSGAFGGHIFGSGSFGGDTKTEPVFAVPPNWPYIWQTLQMPNMLQAKYFMEFVFSEGQKYQKLELASEDLSNARTEAIKMDEWAFMLRETDRGLALLYFEDKTARQTITGMIPDTKYAAQWYNPRTGEWFAMGDGVLVSGQNGTIDMPAFPSGKDVSENDWAAKLKKISDN
jgi:hypothetical protein